MAEKALAAVLACLFSAVAFAAKVERVYAAGPPASVLVFAIAPDKLVGWTRAMRPNEAQFFDERYARLPELGRLTGRGDTANVEVVLDAKVDLIVDVGSTARNAAAEARAAWSDARWRAVEAVSRKRVFLSPHLPFGWFDFPPGANRLLGIWWAGRLLEPEAFDVDLRAKAREFHRRFYHRVPTEAQLDALLGEPGVTPK